MANLPFVSNYVGRMLDSLLIGQQLVLRMGQAFCTNLSGIWRKSWSLQSAEEFIDSYHYKIGDTIELLVGLNTRSFNTGPNVVRLADETWQLYFKNLPVTQPKKTIWRGFRNLRMIHFALRHQHLHLSSRVWTRRLSRTAIKMRLVLLQHRKTKVIRVQPYQLVIKSLAGKQIIIIIIIIIIISAIAIGTFICANHKGWHPQAVSDGAFLNLLPIQPALRSHPASSSSLRFSKIERCRLEISQAGHILGLSWNPAS